MAALRKCAFMLLNTQHLSHLRISTVLTAERSFKRWVAPTLREMNSRRKRMGPQPLSRRSSYLEWNYQAELFAFGKRLGEEFRKDLLQKALTHRSYIVQEEMKQKEVGIENPQLDLEDNRELIKTGEDLMSGYIKRYLRVVLSRIPEEGISALHDHLMKESTLAFVSKNIGTSDIILCSDFPVEESTLAATLKAVVGALAESSGEDRAEKFVRDFVLTQLAGKEIYDFLELKDPMSILSDILNREGRGEPEPRLIGEAGKRTVLAAYQVALYSDKKFIGVGFGESVSIAVEMAAHDALKRLFWTTENSKPISFKMDIHENSTNTGQKNLSLHEWSGNKVENVITC